MIDSIWISTSDLRTYNKEELKKVIETVTLANAALSLSHFESAKDFDIKYFQIESLTNAIGRGSELHRFLVNLLKTMESDYDAYIERLQLKYPACTYMSDSSEEIFDILCAERKERRSLQ